jgi:hypothetical protein
VRKNSTERKTDFDLKEGDFNENFSGTYDILALTILHNNLRGTELFLVFQVLG